MSGDKIINDSSIWRSKESYKSAMSKDLQIKIGQIRAVLPAEGKDDTSLAYRVDVLDAGVFTQVICVPMVKFGGIYNFEETTYRPYTPDNKAPTGGRFSLKAGDMVVVGFLGGDSKEGVILGSLRHPGRAETLVHEKDNIAYISVFNGIETKINNDGEFTQTFKGQPKNLAKLKSPPNGQPIAKPEYDEKIGTSFYKWDKTGSFTLSDNAQEKPITLKIDKPAGIFTLAVGETNIKIEKASDTITIKNKVTTWNTETSFSMTTKATKIDSSDSVSVTSNKIDTKGKWSQTGDMKITGKVEISGDLKNQGQALLAGGANPLIYDIILIMGTGNLGAPVISQPTVLKTVKTKAT